MTAIPAAHLIALGFEKGDPPVQSATGLPVSFKQREVLQRSPRMLLLVEESMPTLLRALARQHGAVLKPGEVPTWYKDHKGRWWLEWDDAGSRHIFAPVNLHEDGYSAVPALTADMGRLESFAAVIAWQVSR